MDSKLCPRQTTRFKRCSSHRDSKTTSTSLALREETMFKKAYELSALCDIQVCVLYYDRGGELIKTWPEDKAKVRDMAERFNQLSDIEKRKKSSNLSEFLAKKMSDEKKHEFKKFTQKLLEMEYSLERRLPILQDRLRLLLSDCGGIPSQPLIDLSTSLVDDQSRQQWTEPSMNPLSELPVLQDQLFSPHEEVSSDSGIPQPLSLFDDPPHQQWTESLVNAPSIPSLNHHDDQSKFSIFLYNHENGNFTQLASSFDQSFNNLSSTGLLGAQGFDVCSKDFVDLPPPLMMQTFPSSYY